MHESLLPGTYRINISSTFIIQECISLLQRNMISWPFFICTAVRALNGTTAETGSGFPVRQSYITHRSAEIMANRLQLGRKLVADKTLQRWWKIIGRKWLLLVLCWDTVLEYVWGWIKKIMKTTSGLLEREVICQTPAKYKCSSIKPTCCDK
jgi:hypothetical protein